MLFSQVHQVIGFAFATYNGAIIIVPLKLISFDAVKRDDYVLVKWVTENEQDNNFFTIERSQNGLLFQYLAKVASQGNSTSTQIYNENDRNPLPGRSYYRLKWTDADGKSLYSEVRSVLFPANSGKDFILFPNPNDGSVVYLQLENIQANETISITVSDMQGKGIYQAQRPSISAGRISINLPSTLAKGMYSVTVLRNGERSTKILIVQ